MGKTGTIVLLALFALPVLATETTHAAGEGGAEAPAHEVAPMPSEIWDFGESCISSSNLGFSPVPGEGRLVVSATPNQGGKLAFSLRRSDFQGGYLPARPQDQFRAEATAQPALGRNHAIATWEAKQDLMIENAGQKLKVNETQASYFEIPDPNGGAPRKIIVERNQPVKGPQNMLHKSLFPNNSQGAAQWFKLYDNQGNQLSIVAERDTSTPPKMAFVVTQACGKHMPSRPANPPQNATREQIDEWGRQTTAWTNQMIMDQQAIFGLFGSGHTQLAHDTVSYPPTPRDPATTAYISALTRVKESRERREHEISQDPNFLIRQYLLASFAQTPAKTR